MGRDAEIDRLFQLPLEEFTKARNALAAQAGSDGAEIRRLQKPPLAAWAVNQLYWKKRDAYDALVDAAEALRRAHKAVLSGRQSDLRAAGQAHDRALEAALKETLAVAAAEGQKITDATKQGIAGTLRALPAAGPPGRLTETLRPGGFEMLAGIVPSRDAAARVPSQPEAMKGKGRGAKAARSSHASEGPSAREIARAKEAAADASRALRDAEQQARRDEFEKARAARDAEKARAQMDEAREALAAAEQAVQEAERKAAAADRTHEKAEKRAAESAASVAAARDRAESAQAAVDAIKSPSSRGR